MKVFVVLMMVTIYCSAQVNEQEKSLSNFMTQFPILKEKKWQIYNYMGSEETAVRMVLIRKDGDSTISAILNKSVTFKPPHDWIYDLEFTSAYEQDGEDHWRYYDENGQLLYHYKYVEPQGVKYFITGKYLFLYLYIDTFSPGQRAYFEAHSDSLRKVKGDSLPPLPSIRKNKKKH